MDDKREKIIGAIGKTAFDKVSNSKLIGAAEIAEMTRGWFYHHWSVWVIVLAIFIVITVVVGAIKDDLCPNTSTLKWFKWIFGIGIAISCIWGIIYPAGSIGLALYRLKDVQQPAGKVAE